MLAENSQISSMRVMSLISLTSGIIIAIIGLVKGSNLSEVAILAGVFVGSAFGGKALQKFSETKE